MDEEDVCPICGDIDQPVTETITQDLSEDFMLDTGTMVCEDCFNMEMSRIEPEELDRWWLDE